VTTRVALITGCGKRDGVGQGMDRQDVVDVPVDVRDSVIRVNLRGTYLMSRFAVPVMRAQRHGRIINTAELTRRGRAIAVGRPGRPDDIAAAVAYLASEASAYMTGQTLALDGGGISPFPLTRPSDNAQPASPAGPSAR
jgi:NAD(P)-dependent dehydrogenase (short-subunit alcohol dehydrogenase family)